MKKYIHSSTNVKRQFVVNASSTRSHISDLEAKIKKLQQEYDYRRKMGADVDELIDYELELNELRDELNFAWQDDEAEYNYAMQQQEFNPDGSLRGYDDDIDASTDVKASQIIPNKKIQKGMQWNRDWHCFEVISRSGNKCKIRESWIAEDTGKPRKNVESYIIVDDNGQEYVYVEGDERYARPGSDDYSWWARFYATGADNYPYYSEEEVKEDEYDDEEDYTPSSTRGDYSPSNPWDAPGMSVRDFI